LRLLPKYIILITVLISVGTLHVNAQYVSQLSNQFRPVVKVDTLMSSSLYRRYPKLSFYLPSEDIHLGLACKIENKQYYFKKKRFNYRMRLGNLDYVNYLEGKSANY